MSVRRRDLKQRHSVVPAQRRPYPLLRVCLSGRVPVAQLVVHSSIRVVHLTCAPFECTSHRAHSRHRRESHPQPHHPMYQPHRHDSNWNQTMKRTQTQRKHRMKRQCKRQVSRTPVNHPPRRRQPTRLPLTTRILISHTANHQLSRAHWKVYQPRRSHHRRRRRLLRIPPASLHRLPILRAVLKAHRPSPRSISLTSPCPSIHTTRLLNTILHRVICASTHRPRPIRNIRTMMNTLTSDEWQCLDTYSWSENSNDTHERKT